MKSLTKTLASIVSVSALSLSLAMPAFATYSNPTCDDCTSALVSILDTTQVLIGSILVPININVPVKVYDINLFNDSEINVINDSLNNVSAEDLVNLQNAFKNAKFLNLSNLSLVTGNDILIKNNRVATDIVSVYKSLDGIVVFCK